MPIASGTTLGVYEIATALGAGGMGEVYRARDTKLGRSVAIKVLPDVFLFDADRVARFTREARTLASLNHPRIAALHGMEQSNGRHFLVMELVEGETLADRLQRGPMPPRDALTVARQIAEALEAAHEKGVIHRDLKPGNVKITPEDQVKVLDFGLAKAMDSDASAANIANSPTLSGLATQAGIILGTAAYMSPEQAKGASADQRSDIFSFGIVLFEMLTGRRPFQGETAADVLASVIVRDPELTALPRDLNPRIVDLVRRCLEKPPKRRWQAIGDVRAEIETILAAPSTISMEAVTAPAAPMWRREILIAGAAILGGVLTALAIWSRPASRAPEPVTRFTIQLPADHLIPSVARQLVAVAPDGTHVAYAANGRIYLRPMSGLDVHPIQGVENTDGVTAIAFSPDSRSLVFWSGDRTLKRIPMIGGAPVTLCEAENPLGLNWTPDGIFFGQIAGIMRMSAAGGKPELLIRAESGEVLFGPQRLPGGDALMFTAGTSATPEGWNRAVIVSQSLKTGERKKLIEPGADGRYVSTGHIVYAIGGTLYAAPFDPHRRETTGGPTAVLEGVLRATGGASGGAQFAFADNGSLAYMAGPPGATASQFDLAMTDRKGVVELLKLPNGPYEYPRVSPDGKRITFGTDDGREAVVWVYELAGRGAMQRLTSVGKNRFPIWSADDQRIAFQSDREGDAAIFWQRADRTGGAERLTKPEPGTTHIPDAWSPDGKHLLFTTVAGSSFTLSMLRLADRTTAPFGTVQSRALATPAFSPDGRWVAYSASSTGTTATQVYVQPFPPTGAQYQLFARTGDLPHHPLWAPDGKELLYVPRVGEFEAVTVETKPTFIFGRASRVPRTFPTAAPSTPRTFDMAPNGKIVGVIVPGQSPVAGTLRSIQVVLNWSEELKAQR
ncbi:MAG: protein kinase [Vicinamibacterales bacterium]